MLSSCETARRENKKNNNGRRGKEAMPIIFKKIIFSRTLAFDQSVAMYSNFMNIVMLGNDCNEFR